MGLSPSLVLFSKRLPPVPLLVVGPKTTIQGPKGPNFHLEFFPLHSPLLKESKFVSFPLLTYMLKFSRFAILTSGQQKEVISTRDVDKLPDRPPSASRPQG